MTLLDNINNMPMDAVASIVAAPADGTLEPGRRFDSCLALSALMARMATVVVCHTIVDYEDLLSDERLSVASAFLQRVTSTHLCNHKLTSEGIVFNYSGQEFSLHEEFKTMALTRSAYEHLVMFFFVFSHPRTREEGSVVWNYWKINSMKNTLDFVPASDEEKKREQVDTFIEIEQLRKEIFATRIGQLCSDKLDEWTAIGKPTQNGCIEFYRNHGRTDVRRVSYNQAWKYLSDNEDMAQLYRHLSIHCHPIYNGLLQYQGQAQTDEGYDGLPLYLSSCFLARLCGLFVKMLPKGGELLRQQFCRQELFVFDSLAKAVSRKIANNA